MEVCMPRAPKACGINGCRTIVPNGKRCPDHNHGWRGPRTASSEATSGSNTAEWRAIREEVLNDAGRRCQIGYPGICIGTATVVDKKTPATQRPDLARTRSNLRAACEPCNDHKARTEDQGRPA